MIALDTNLLVYAHRQDSPFHQSASAVLERLAAGAAAWAIPWPCAHEFIAVVTHPRIYRQPTPLAAALQTIQALAHLPQLQWLAETDGYLERLAALAKAAKVHGGAIHDARIAALCVHHGVRELWSADRDFGRYPELKVVNPLVREPG